MKSTIERLMLFLGIIALICGIYFFLFYEPTYLLPPWAQELDRKDLIQAENSARATLVQAIGGAILLIGLLFTWRTLAATLENVGLTQDKQITERFTKAVEQLGHEKYTIRIGGIYALERIARESKKDHWSIMEILTSYVRESSSQLKTKDEKAFRSIMATLKDRILKRSTQSDEHLMSQLSPDAEAIINVFRRRNSSNECKGQSLNLEGANLWNANFTGADLKGANLQGANLQGARFYGAHLEGADFSGALLWGTDLTEAYLNGANFTGAELQHASLIGADVKGAIWHKANLSEANLTDAKNINESLKQSLALP